MFVGGPSPQVGFGLAKSQRNDVDPAELRGQRGQLLQEAAQRGNHNGENRWVFSWENPGNFPRKFLGKWEFPGFLWAEFWKVRDWNF